MIIPVSQITRFIFADDLIDLSELIEQHLGILRFLVVTDGTLWNQYVPIIAENAATHVPQVETARWALFR